jgi:hypothetical protein
MCDKSTEPNPRCRTKVELPKTDEEWLAIMRVSSFGLLRHWMRFRNLSPLRDTEDQFCAWYELVEIYSKRTLTYQSDVLSALAGLAKELASTQNIGYTNGLWKNDLPMVFYGGSTSTLEQTASLDHPLTSLSRTIIPKLLHGLGSLNGVNK